MKTEYLIKEDVRGENMKAFNAIHSQIDIKILKRCIAATMVWGLIAHAYGFLNFTISHDSLEALYSGSAEIEWKISIGRIFVTVYRLLTRGLLTTPWLIGVLALLWIGFSVYLLTCIFEMNKEYFIVLVAGIMTVNPTVTALTATFMHDLDVDMFALFLSVLAVYLWKKYRWGIWVGMVLLAFGLGLYQSYLSVAIALIMIVSIMALLEEQKCREVIAQGIKGIVMLLGGGILYLISLQLVCRIEQVSLSNSYNSISQLFNPSSASPFWNVLRTYYYWAMYFLRPVTPNAASILTVGNLLLGICVLGIILGMILGKKMKIGEKLLLVSLGSLLPLGMNISCILSEGMLHGLMKYAFCLIYLLALMVGEWSIRRAEGWKLQCVRVTRILMTVVIIVVICNDLLVANAAYLKKELERQQTLSLMTRVVSMMDSREDYKRGETVVAFVGKIDMEEMPGFEMFEGDGNMAGVQGLTANDQIKNYRDYEAYFRYILNIPINLCEEEQRLELWKMEEVQNMPEFPDDGCMKMINGMFVVKMGERY